MRLSELGQTTSSTITKVGDPGAAGGTVVSVSGPTTVTRSEPVLVGSMVTQFNPTMVKSSTAPMMLTSSTAPMLATATSSPVRAATTSSPMLATTTVAAPVLAPIRPSSMPGSTTMSTGASGQYVTMSTAQAVPSTVMTTIQPQQAAPPSTASVSSGGQVATVLKSTAPSVVQVIPTLPSVVATGAAATGAKAPALAPIAVRGATPGAAPTMLTPAPAGPKPPPGVPTQQPTEAAATGVSTSKPWLGYGLAVFGVLAVVYALKKKQQ